VSVGWCNTYEGRKVSRVATCEVRSRKNGQEQKKKRKEKKSTMVSNKKKSTVMSPIQRRMNKRNPSSGQNGQLVHWWLLIHFGHEKLNPSWNKKQQTYWHLGRDSFKLLSLGTIRCLFHIGP
jgi:hypothetical protein